jgi:hypothetical protein
MSLLHRWRGCGGHSVVVVADVDCPSAVAVAAVPAPRTRAAREALGRTEEDDRVKKRAAALEAWLGELEANATALAVGEHGVLLAAPLRDVEEESAALGARLAAAREALSAPRRMRGRRSWRQHSRRG